MSPLVPKKLFHPPEQRHRGKRKERSDEARPPLIHPEYAPAEVHQPEKQRRLVAVGLAIHPGDEEIAAPPHLPGDRGVARLVHGPERAQPQRGDCERRPAGQKERKRAVGGRFQSSASSTSPPRVLPCRYLR